MYLWILSCRYRISRYRITHYVAVAYINRRLLWQPVMHMHPWSFIANVLSDCPSMALDQKSDATTCIASTWMHMNSSIKYSPQHIFFVISWPTCGNAEVTIKTALNRLPAPHMPSFAWKMAQHLQSQLKDNERCLSRKLSDVSCSKNQGFAWGRPLVSIVGWSVAVLGMSPSQHVGGWSDCGKLRMFLGRSAGQKQLMHSFSCIWRPRCMECSAQQLWWTMEHPGWISTAVL